MRSLIVFPLVLALALAEEHFAPSHSKSHTHFNSHTQPVDQATLEEELVEEGMNHHPIHQQEEVPHPHLVHQDQFHPKMTSTDNFPKKFPGETESHNPVPNPHLVVDEAEPQTGAEGDAFQGPFEEIDHNAVEQPVYIEEEIPSGTENTLNEDFFEHPNTGLPEIEPTVGTESGVGMEVVQEPVVLPVTEGKNRGQDPVVHYTLPKELMPIHPGGGSRFEDLEKEKMEKKKMAQTKGTDEDTENSASHEAEGLYSSAAKLCLSSLIFTLSSSFRLIV